MLVVYHHSQHVYRIPLEPMPDKNLWFRVGTATRTFITSGSGFFIFSNYFMVHERSYRMTGLIIHSAFSLLTDMGNAEIITSDTQEKTASSGTCSVCHPDSKKYFSIILFTDSINCLLHCRSPCPVPRDRFRCKWFKSDPKRIFFCFLFLAVSSKSDNISLMILSYFLDRPLSFSTTVAPHPLVACNESSKCALIMDRCVPWINLVLVHCILMTTFCSLVIQLSTVAVRFRPNIYGSYWEEPYGITS